MIATSGCNDQVPLTSVNRPMDIKRVLLVTPVNRDSYFKLDTVLHAKQSMEPPLGLSYISAYAKKALDDIEVEVFDPNLEAIKHIRAVGRSDMDELWALVEKKMREFQPDVVGISCLFHILHKNAHRMARIAKSLDKKPVTVMGGNYPAGLPNFALSDECLDFVIFSEGEITFSQLIMALRMGFDPSAVTEGIAFREHVFERLGIALKHDDKQSSNVRAPVVIPKKDFVKSLDVFPWPDRSNYDMEFYATNVRHFVNRLEDGSTMRLATMTASRGCPFSCTFCASKDFWGNQIRYRDPLDVVDEMQHLQESYGINTFVFNDDNVMFNSNSVIALCNEIKRRNMKITWFAGGGLQVSTLRKPELVAAIIETGLRQFNLAIESGDKETLRRIKKPLKDAEMAQHVISNIRKYDNVWIQGFFISGFWFQTIEQIMEAHKFSGTLDLDWRGFYNFAPLPGTEDYEICVERGYIKDFRTLDGEYAEEMIHLSTENFVADQIHQLNYSANLEYNFLKNRNLVKNPMQALKDFDYILELYSDHAFAHYCRGLALKKLNRIEEATTALTKARNLAIESKNLERDTFVSNIQILDTSLRWIDYFRRADIMIDDPDFVARELGNIGERGVA